MDDFKERLFKPRLPEGEVTVEGIGTVRVRALSRVEAVRVSETNGTAAKEQLILHLGLVEPKLSMAEVKRWQEASAAGEIDPVTEQITRLSGMGKESSKSGVQDAGE